MGVKRKREREVKRIASKFHVFLKVKRLFVYVTDIEKKKKKGKLHFF
jgi:hypothetical protein